MPATPQITLTATLSDIAGAAAGSTSNPAVLRIALAGFGLTLPCIAGTANVAKVGPQDFYDTGGGVSVALWGNDVLTPAETYYAITVLDGDGNIVQSGAYRFTGTQTIDLSSAPQIYPGPPPTPPTPTPTFAWDVVPTPPIDTSGNATFTLPQVPSPPASLNLFKSGARMTAGIAFTLNGAVITYEAGYIPQDGDSHICNYMYSGS
jgi:hypothetical protein